MSLFDRQKRQNTTQQQINDKFFMFMGRWYARGSDDRGTEFARLVYESDEVQVTQDYVDAWSGVKQTLGNSDVIYKIYS